MGEKKQVKMEAASFSDEKLVIALDFGTTYSGVAFCFPNQSDPKVASIMDWPGGESAPKVHTLISYDAKDSTKFSWGASVNRMTDSISGIKLLLDPAQERPLYLPTGDLQRDIRRLPKKTADVAADYIRSLFQHALSEITKKVPQGYLAMCQREYVLTVPAVWSDVAKNLTLEAARKAGIHPVTLIKEPEAAALYTMHSMNFALEAGDAFVVCDAGGGTVDLISYEVTAITPRLQLKELVPGTGGMAGSLGLNQRFVEAVRNLVGEDQFVELRKTKGFWLAEKAFDRDIKKAYRGDKNEEYYITFPMANLKNDLAAGLESNTWRMTGKDLHTIFTPLISDILRLIKDQVRSVEKKRPNSRNPVTGICLVGGFGSSQYLKSCVEKDHPRIQVLQPNDAWAAIAKGAALSLLPHKATVVSTSSAKHYGVSSWNIKDPFKDAGQVTREWRDGTVRVDKMTWFIGMGDDMHRDQKIRHSFFRNLDKNYSSTHLIFEDKLYECCDAFAPQHPSSGKKFTVNCTLKSDMRALTKRHMTEHVDKNGETYYQVSYDLVITMQSALMKFSLEYNGHEMGSVVVKYGEQ